LKIYVLILLTLFNFLKAEIYPSKPITLVVGFGQGGSTDRMVRSMSYYLEEEFKVPINVINIKSKGTLTASKYVLSQPNDGYTIYASTFLPYLVNTVLEEDSNFTIDDFSMLNFQWFDFDFIAVNKNSKFNSILELISYMKNPENKKLTVAVLPNSSAHIILKLLLKNEFLVLSLYSSPQIDSNVGFFQEKL
jgi:tripartite-type tricarboxylate transporter receptor subunit TctC